MTDTAPTPDEELDPERRLLEALTAEPTR